MSESLEPLASSALTELLEVSPQVTTAIVVQRSDGEILAFSSTSPDQRGDELGAIALELLEAAEIARVALDREPVVQIEVATPEGHTFLVSDSERAVLAITVSDPTVGLVFYDLKSTLRTLRDTKHITSLPTEEPAAQSVEEPERVARWRRRK